MEFLIRKKEHTASICEWAKRLNRLVELIVSVDRVSEGAANLRIAERCGVSVITIKRWRRLYVNLYVLSPRNQNLIADLEVIYRNKAN